MPQLSSRGRLRLGAAELLLRLRHLRLSPLANLVLFLSSVSRADRRTEPAVGFGVGGEACGCGSNFSPANTSKPRAASSRVQCARGAAPPRLDPQADLR